MDFPLFAMWAPSLGVYYKRLYDAFEDDEGTKNTWK